MESSIRDKLTTALQPSHLQIINESHMHAGPATDSHFKLVVVASAFEELSRVKRHQLLYKLLADALAGPVHALALHTYTPAEWDQVSQRYPPSPDCKGGDNS